MATDKDQPKQPKYTNPDAPPANPNPPTNPTPTPVADANTPPPEAPYTPTPGQFAVLRALLTRYGLIDLYDTAVNWMIDGTADSPERLEIALRETQQFRDRFKGMFDREQRGLPPISVDEYLAYEGQAYALARQYDFPPGYYDDPTDFAKWIGDNVSLVELEQRFAGFAEIASIGGATAREELSRHAAGLGGEADVAAMSDGDLAAFFAGVTSGQTDRSLQAIRGRVKSAQISASARNAGFGALSASEADRLQGMGLDQGSAAQSFGAIAHQREVIGQLAGEDAAMSRERVLAAAGGDAAAADELEKRQAKRVGQFRRGGGFAGGNQGLGGLGAS